ncbi:hypothetical protein EON83_12710 [bacterium]|nr:MAG: hypothetical protein EON83_12710 [bacterium]
MFNPSPLPRDPRRRNNSRCGSTFDGVRDYFLDRNPFLLFSLGMAVLSLLAQAMPYILAGVYTAIAFLSLASWTVLDFAFGSRLVGEFPALMWMIWGAVLGGSSAFWLSAPLYGWRNKRAFIILLPLLVMVISALVINLRTPLPTQPELLETAPAAPAPNTAPPTVIPN